MLRGFARLLLCLFLCGALLAGEQTGVWLDVPFVKQGKDACGAASIAMVMQYWRQQLRGAAEPGTASDADADAPQIQRALYSRAARGIYARELERYLQQHGFRVFAFQGEWKDLQEQLEKGRPLIVALRTGRDDLHYVVVTGLDWQQGVLWKNDPAERKLLKQDRASFENEWKTAGNWTLLAVPGLDVTSSSR